MKTLMEVFNTLGDRMDIILDTSMTKEKRAIENAQTAYLISDAKQMINAAEAVLRIEKFAAQNRCLEEIQSTKLI